VPYKSDKQRKFMHAQHPEIAKRWDKEYKTLEYVKGRDDPKTRTLPYRGPQRSGGNKLEDFRSRDTELGGKVLSTPRRRAAPSRTSRPASSEPSKGSRESAFTDFMKNNRNGYNPYAAGNKVYGGGRSAPNVGPTNSKEGYLDRDARGKMRRNALLRRMKASQKGKYNSSDWMRGQR
jgi:hypothetical protein